MSTRVDTSRHAAKDRTAAAPRHVVVPDRTIRRTQMTSPIINLQPLPAVPKPTVVKKMPVRHRPVESSKVHSLPQKAEPEKVTRPKIRKVEQSPAEAMEALLKRHKTLPKHLARTAGRAHLLSRMVELESQKVRWHQKLLATFSS